MHPAHEGFLTIMRYTNRRTHSLTRLTLDVRGIVTAGCPSPRQPEHGVYVWNSDDNSVRFACRPGFIVVGDVSISCRRGRWTSPPPLCLSQSSISSYYFVYRFSGRVQHSVGLCTCPDDNFRQLALDILHGGSS